MSFRRRTYDEWPRRDVDTKMDWKYDPWGVFYPHWAYELRERVSFGDDRAFTSWPMQLAVRWWTPYRRPTPPAFIGEDAWYRNVVEETMLTDSPWRVVEGFRRLIGMEEE